MNRKKNGFGAVNEYIARFSDDVQKILKGLRKAIKTAVPGAEEHLIYLMPAFSLNGNSIYFAAYKNHIDLFPGADGIMVFKKELSDYLSDKGIVQFPIDKPLPFQLIGKIAKFTVSNVESESSMPFEEVRQARQRPKLEKKRIFSRARFSRSELSWL